MCGWLRGTDSNRRPSGYEPDELPLLHPATADDTDRSATDQTAVLPVPRGPVTYDPTPVRKSRRNLRRTDGLRARTGPRTVPHMFGRHRTTPDQVHPAVAEAFHERLARSSMPRVAEPARIDPRNLRRRLAGPASPGLRDRMGRGLSPS
jgi:hypothetical protein